MNLYENQKPNICDSCGSKTTINHFHTKKDHWIALCRDCQSSIVSMVFATASENKLISFISVLKARHGQNNLDL